MRFRTLVLAFALLWATPIQAQDWKKQPWIEPQDTAMALFAPDEYAWRLFLALNWPSRLDDCGPDTTKKIGDAGQAVWERWPSKNDVFLAGAAKPKSWSELCKSAAVAKSLSPSAQLALSRELRPRPAFDRPDGDASTAADEEVRMNQSTLTFIVENELYSLTKQRALAASGVAAIDFPHNAKEVKAHWKLLPDAADHSRYHTGTSDGKTYGLVALHITTKDLPRWFWATYEHVDNEKRWPQEFPGSFAGWTVAPRDTYACPADKPSCAALPSGIGLENTKWQFYRLKATQTDWVDLQGEPTLVVNSKIESGFIQAQSSCISCHSLALIGERGPTMPFVFVTDGQPDAMGRDPSFIGVVSKADRRPKPGVDPNWKFLQLDFVWSLRNARPQN